MNLSISWKTWSTYIHTQHIEGWIHSGPKDFNVSFVENKINASLFLEKNWILQSTKWNEYIVIEKVKIWVDLNLVSFEW